MPELSSTLRALVGLFLRHRGHVGWVVIKILVPFQMLLLSEALVTLVTLERFLVCVNQHVRLKVALEYGRVGTEVALIAFLSLVCFLVNF